MEWKIFAFFAIVKYFCIVTQFQLRIIITMMNDDTCKSIFTHRGYLFPLPGIWSEFQENERESMWKYFLTSASFKQLKKKWFPIPKIITGLIHCCKAIEYRRNSNAVRKKDTFDIVCRNQFIYNNCQTAAHLRIIETHSFERIKRMTRF